MSVTAYRDDDTRIRMAFLKAHPVESVGIRKDGDIRYLSVGITAENLRNRLLEIPRQYEGMNVHLYETTRAILAI